MHRDELPGIYRRSVFGPARGPWLRRINRTPCALIMTDMDDFKMVKDVHCHGPGDVALAAVAAWLAATT